MKIDLHNHTKASDARLTRQELLQIASVNNLSYIAITDHDTMLNSYCEDQDPVHVIRGCELSAAVPEYATRAHLLCYLPKDTAPLDEYFEQMKKERNQKAEIMIELVHQQFPIVTMNSVMDRVGKSKIIYKLHIMQVLIDFGYTHDVYGDLYKKLFSTKHGSCYVGLHYNDAYDLLGRIHEARGVAVFAHPSVYKSIPFVAELAKKGLIDGIEYNHPKNTVEDKKAIAELCNRFQLIATGGSDYHGGNNSSNVIVGDYLTDETMFESLLSISDTK